MDRRRRRTDPEHERRLRLHVDPDRGLILLKGGVPGPRGGYLRVFDAVKSALPQQAPFPAAIVHRGEALEAIVVEEGGA